MSPLGRGAVERSFLAEARAGIAYVFAQRWLATLFALDAILALVVAGPLTVALPLLAQEEMAVGPIGYSWLVAGLGGGGIVGLLLAGSILSVPKRVGGYYLLALVQAPLIASLAGLPIAFAVFALVLVGALNGLGEVAYLGLIQGRVSAEMLGRVMGVGLLASFGLQPISQIITGTLLAWIGAGTLLIAAGILVAVTSVAGLAATRSPAD